MSDIEEQPTISVITILRGEKEFIPLIKDNFNKFEYPQDKLELVIVESLQINAWDAHTYQFNSGMIFSENNFIDFMTFACDIPPKSKLHPKYCIPS